MLCDQKHLVSPKTGMGSGEADTEVPEERPLMYCAEQIEIPLTFPNILKSYAKAVIRTQPYDLLRWSAAYFRCLATDVPPPVKVRLERDVRFGTLTRGYLRVLLEQVGKGFFINRDILQDRWKSLALPEEELLGFLSLCRMLHWPQVHWLKLFAVMVGSLNNTLIETMQMICELLTEHVEGSPCPIPMWTIREVYTFIAELDCGLEQRFIDGRKVVGVDDLLEDPSPFPELPKLLNMDAFRNAILERYQELLGIESDSDFKEFPYRLDCGDKIEDDVVSMESQGSRPSAVSSSFKFIGDYSNPTDVIRRTTDFDSVILLLHESEGYQLHNYDGAHTVNEKTLRHARRRAQERKDRIEHQHNVLCTKTAEITDDEHNLLLKSIQPPWSWIHKFATTNCHEKSFNFIEMQSLPSDETPTESSDESFDFDRKCFHAVAESVGSKASADTEEADLTEMLLRNLAADEDSGLIHSQDVVDMNSFLTDILDRVVDAVQNKTLMLQQTSSLLSFLDEQKTRSDLNLKAIRIAIRRAEESHMVFHTMKDLENYLCEELHLRKVTSVVRPVSAETVATITIPDTPKSPTQLVKSSPMPDESSYATSHDEPCADAPTGAVTVEPAQRQNLEDKFDECQIEIDEKITKKKVPSKMILGLISTPPATPIIIPTPPRTPSEPPPTPHDTTSGIITRNVSLHEFQPDHEVPPRPPQPAGIPPPPFKCTIPPIPGIGPSVTKQTIINFLTYLKGRSRDEKGLVFPRHFREAKCPNIVDTYDYSN